MNIIRTVSEISDEEGDQFKDKDDIVQGTGRNKCSK